MGNYRKSQTWNRSPWLGSDGIIQWRETRCGGFRGEKDDLLPRTTLPVFDSFVFFGDVNPDPADPDSDPCSAVGLLQGRQLPCTANPNPKVLQSAKTCFLLAGHSQTSQASI